MSVAVVAGALANKPGSGGAAWTRLSWLLGLQQAGMEVHFVEALRGTATETSTRWWDLVVGAFGLASGATLLDGTGRPVRGLRRAQLEALLGDADLLLNISGNLQDPQLRDRARTRVYLDLDPGYTQLWHAQGLLDLSGHDHHYSVGLAIGSGRCTLPTGNIAWRPTLQPVLLGDWPVQPPPREQRFTTVGAWRGPYGTVAHQGMRLGPKAHQFRRFWDLPRRSAGTYELALDIATEDSRDRAVLEQGGWRLVDPRAVAGHPQAFRAYVQGSAAECSVAQGMYVQTGCGWFSDRSTRYLASGRPVLVQDTGFAPELAVGQGVVTFTDLAGAAAGARSVLDDYSGHARAARRLAEERFAAHRVCGQLRDEVGAGSGQALVPAAEPDRRPRADAPGSGPHHGRPASR